MPKSTDPMLGDTAETVTPQRPIAPKPIDREQVALQVFAAFMARLPNPGDTNSGYDTTVPRFAQAALIAADVFIAECRKQRKP